MALESVSGFMPSWPNEEIYIRTLEEREKLAPEDLISIYSPVYQYYKAKDLIEYPSDIGIYNPITVQTAENETRQGVQRLRRRRQYAERGPGAGARALRASHGRGDVQLRGDGQVAPAPPSAST